MALSPISRAGFEANLDRQAEAALAFRPDNIRRAAEFALAGMGAIALCFAAVDMVNNGPNAANVTTITSLALAGGAAVAVGKAVRRSRVPANETDINVYLTQESYTPLGKEGQ